LRIHGYVVSENHLHLIARSDTLDRDIRRFKSFTARRIIDLLQTANATTLLRMLKLLKGEHKPQSTYKLGQEGSHPQRIEHEDVMRQKLEYIHFNPSALSNDGLLGLDTFRVGIPRYLCASPAYQPKHRRGCCQPRRKARYWAGALIELNAIAKRRLLAWGEECDATNKKTDGARLLKAIRTDELRPVFKFLTSPGLPIIPLLTLWQVIVFYGISRYFDNPWDFNVVAWIAALSLLLAILVYVALQSVEFLCESSREPAAIRSNGPTIGQRSMDGEAGENDRQDAEAAKARTQEEGSRP
jgi:hypothetical protein